MKLPPVDRYFRGNPPPPLPRRLSRVLSRVNWTEAVAGPLIHKHHEGSPVASVSPFPGRLAERGHGRMETAWKREQRNGHGIRKQRDKDIKGAEKGKRRRPLHGPGTAIFTLSLSQLVQPWMQLLAFVCTNHRTVSPFL